MNPLQNNIRCEWIDKRLRFEAHEKYIKQLDASDIWTPKMEFISLIMVKKNIILQNISSYHKVYCIF